MSDNKTQEELLKEYEEKNEALLQEMMRVVIRAQRKVDDEAYRKTLEKIEKGK